MTSLSDLCLLTLGSLCRHGSAHWTALCQESCLRAPLSLSALQGTRFPNQTTWPCQLHLQFSSRVSSTIHLLKTDLSVSITTPASVSLEPRLLHPHTSHSCAQSCKYDRPLSFPVPVSSKGLFHLDPRLQSLLYPSSSPNFSSKEPTDGPLKGPTST